MMLKAAFIITLLLVSTATVLAQGKNKQAIVGPVENVGLDSLTVTDKRSKIKTQVAVDGTTPLVDNQKRATKLGAVKIKDLIAVISADGATPGGKLKVQKIFVKSATDSAKLKRQAVMGVITSINGNTITLAHQIHSERTYTVLLTPQTIIKFKSQKTTPTSASPAGVMDATSSASLATLAVGQRIVAMGDITPQGISARSIHIIPGFAKGVVKKLPTPISSPLTSASPSASPVVSPTPTGTPSASLTPAPTPTP